MAEPGFYLSEDDVRALKRRMGSQDHQRQNVPRQNPLLPPEWSPENYLALPPCGECIPPRSGSTPGHKECCIFRMAASSAEDFQGKTYRIEPVLTDASDPTSIRRAEVYNIWDDAACFGEQSDPRYIPIRLENYGRFFCDRPSGEPTSTTTTAAPIGVQHNACSGTCKWVWDNVEKTWSIDEDGCNTTTTTVDPSTTTTTTTACLCPATTTAAPTTTTGAPDPSTTTTTTAAPCQCVPPQYCGTDDCEVTHTYCSTDAASFTTPDCGQTTTTPEPTTTSSTTTSDTTTSGGPTTTTGDPCTTTLPPECQGECEWINVPGYGLKKISDTCAATCPCPQPISDSECGQIVTVCDPPPTTTSTTTTDYPCTLSCPWVCVETPGGGTGWINLIYRCPGNASNDPAHCRCDAPTELPCIPCETTETHCYQPGAATSTAAPTTTPSPCATTDTTSSTTSSTTTTPGCETATCKWRWEVGATEWASVEDECPEECPCSGPPLHEGEDCETVVRSCGPSTTTSTSTTTAEPTTTTETTTSTTTTVEPCTGTVTWVWSTATECWSVSLNGCTGDCVNPAESCIADGPAGAGTFDGEETATACNCDAGGQQPGPCYPSTTTTTTAGPTSESPTTTCAPVSDCNCMWRFTEGQWVQVEFNCHSGCGGASDCSPPAGGGSEGECQETVCQ